MKYLYLKKLFLACVAACACNLAAGIETQKVLLDGQWDFATIEGDGAVSQSGKIKVPSAWEAQGYGKPTDKTNFNFVGVGRYEREFDLPDYDFDTRYATLVLEGVSRYAKIWINGEYVGEAKGLTGSHRLFVKKYLKFGSRNKIKIEVDSRQRMFFDAMLGAAQLNDYMNIVWGGLYGHVYIEVPPETHLSDFYVRSRISPASFIAEARVNPPYDKNKKNSSWFSSDKSDKPQTLKLEVFDADGKLVGSKSELVIHNTYEVQRVEAKVADAKLWSPDSPYLYNLKISVLDEDGNEIHSVKWRAGIREITTGAKLAKLGKRYKPYQFYLNGKPLFLTGYGDDHIYVKEFSMPADKQMYIERLRKIKALGFNHVRLHSTIMPPEYFEACDEVGIMPNAEFTIGYPWQMPNSEYWLKNAPHGASAEKSFDFYRERLRSVVKDYRNYTCLFAWVGGNELFMGEQPFDVKNPLIKQFEDIVRETDPDRLFLDTDGDWAKEMPQNIRPTMDFVSALYNEWADFADFGEKYVNPKSLGTPQLPIISHETANFCTFTRPDIVKFFEGSVFKPFWLTDAVKKLEEQGRTQKAHEWATATEKIALRCHKHNIEWLRKNPHISGYHWWLIQDYWTSSDGIFDYAFELKRGFDAQTIANFNAPTVLLQNGIEFAYTGGDKISAEILVSNFSQNEFDAPVEAELKLGGKTLAKFAPAKCAPVGIGTVGKIAEITGIEKAVDADAKTPQHYTLEVSAKSGGKTFRNEWRWTVFPAKPKPAKNVFATKQGAIELPEFWNAKIVESADALGSGDVLFVRKLEKNQIEALKRGATVVLIRPDRTPIPSQRMQYKSAWWRAGGIEDTNYSGNFVEKDSPLAAVAPENYCVEAMAGLFKESRRYYVEALKTKPAMFIRAVPSMLSLKDYACVFATDVEKGTFIVSGLRHATIRNSPENAWTLKTLAESKAGVSADAEFVSAFVK